MWACTGLGLPAVNHRSVRGPFVLNPPCWNMSYWWILGEGQTVSSAVYSDKLTVLQWMVANSCCTGISCYSLGHKTKLKWVSEKRDWPGGKMYWRWEGSEKVRVSSHVCEIVTGTNLIKHFILFHIWLVFKRWTILVAQWIRCLLYKYENAVSCAPA